MSTFGYKYLQRILPSTYTLVAVATALTLSIVISWVYFDRVEFPNIQKRILEQHKILTHTAQSPYNYRILIPYLTEYTSYALGMVFRARDTAFIAAYVLVNITFTFFFLLLSFYFFSRFYLLNVSLVGILMLGSLMHIALQDHYYQPWSILESVLFLAALVKIHEGRIYWIFPLTIVATLNRETGLLIPALLFFHLIGAIHNPSRKTVAVLAISAFSWFCIFFLLRYLFGSAPHVSSIVEILEKNLAGYSLMKFAFNGTMVLGVWWLFTIPGWLRVDPFIKRSLLILIPYTPLVIVFGIWFEIRLILPLYPLLVAICLAHIENVFSGQDSATLRTHSEHSNRNQTQAPET